jgi:nitrogen fixation NifU-like protein
MKNNPALSLAQAQEISDAFMQLMQSKGTEYGNAELLEDAVALAGVSQYPARIKCALLGWMAFKDASVQAIAKNS